MTDAAADEAGLLSAVVAKFEESEQATSDARNQSARDRDYYDGKQWTEDEAASLKKRGQPVVTFNRIQRKVNYMKGLESQTRKDPKAFPRTPNDDGSAQAATDVLRYVCDDQNWDMVRSEAFEGIIVEGTGAVMVGVQRTRNGVDPVLTNIPFDRLFYDPHSRRVDFSDAAYMGIVTWMDLSAAKATYPQGLDALETTWAESRVSNGYADRPEHQQWADYRRKRVRVIEMYHNDGGGWMRCVFTRAGFLEPPGPSPYHDADGVPECPIKATSAYVDRENNRYGEVRAMISPQDEVNKRRSKGLDLINRRQVRIDPRFKGEAGNVKRELSRPDGVLFAMDGEVEILPTGDMAAANFQMLQEAKAEIDLLGPNAALAGKNENDSSGRAIIAQQQGGMIEVALLMDRLRQLSLAVYRSIWARIRQFWDEPRWIRVTEDERNLRWVGLNTPRTVMDIAREKLADDPEAEFKLAMLARDPRAGMVAEVQNAVAELDVDIVIDEGMDTPTVAAEQFDTLSKMMPGLSQLPPEAMELLVQASSLRDKDKLLTIIENMKQQGPSPEQQAAQQMAMAKEQADIENTQSDTVKNLADAQAKRAGLVADMWNTQQAAGWS